MCPPTAFGHDDSNAQQHTSTVLNDTSFVPNTEVSKAAFNLASSLLVPAILNHSVRVYLYAKSLAEQSDSAYSSDTLKHDLLFAACILHDIGTTKDYDGPQRFEVEGADAAAALLRKQGIKEEDAHQVWIAIAIHTSPTIAERINELSRLVREAVIIDFGRGLDKLGNQEELKTQYEKNLPRLQIEKVLGDAVVEQAVRKPEKAPPASWPNNLYKAFLAERDWDGINKGF
jgi:HD superfamily phosphohydrolase YqeK